MRSMQWQLGILGTISAFAFRNRETNVGTLKCTRIYLVTSAFNNEAYILLLTHNVHVDIQM